MKAHQGFLNNAVLSAIQTISSAFLLFFLYRYLLKKLGADNLGIWAVVLASTSVGRLSDMGFSGAALKFVARCLAYGETQKASEIVQTAAISIGVALAILAAVFYPLLVLALEWSLPKTSIDTALSILPWALLSLWISMVSGILQSALDGCQRMDIRNLLLIVSNIFYFLISLYLVPDYGLPGLAIAQTMQAVLLLFSSWWILRRLLPDLPMLPWQWSMPHFKQMFSYAVNLQIASLAGLLFDPVTKFFLAKYGGLASTAYYEMANQVIIKARAVLVSALQAVIPVLASTKDDEKELRISIYLKTYRLFFLLTWPYYFLLALAFPLISILWIGHAEHAFIFYGVLLASGWCLSNLGVPAYFYNIATGSLGWNTASHLITGGLNVLFAFFLGQIYGAIGVIFATLISLVVPSWLVIFVIQKNLNLDYSQIVEREDRVSLVFIVLSGILGVLLNFKIEILQSNSYLAGITPFLYILFLCIIFWSHPFCKRFCIRIKKKVLSKFLNNQG